MTRYGKSVALAALPASSGAAEFSYSYVEAVADLSKTETTAEAPLAGDADGRLLGIGGSWKLIPNRAMPINSILLLEAQASSEIENIVTTADQRFRQADDAAGRADPLDEEPSATVFRRTVMNQPETVRRPMRPMDEVRLDRRSRLTDITSVTCSRPRTGQRALSDVTVGTYEDRIDPG